MNLSKRWLHDYVNLDVSDQQFADDMTLSGSKVESFETEGADIKNVIVGKVVSLVKHTIPTTFGFAKSTSEQRIIYR